MGYAYQPQSVELTSLVPDQEITWNSTLTTELGFLQNSRWGTVKNLTHIANPATGDLRNKTWALNCTNLNAITLPETITGLQIDISGQRNGRIVDEIIQLTYQGSAIGNNNFVYMTDPDGHLLITNQSTYGGPTDLWGTTLTPEIIQDPSFGVILKFQSHPYYPHSCGMFLDSVLFTVY